jgi:ubiquinone/menaquinone biosynthesis C-methylase UbiE
MAATCPAGFDVPRLRARVRDTYERVAREPEGEFHFHRGLDYAVDFLGYDRSELARLPARATARFAGVGNPLHIGPVRAGETVLDHACGAGMDLLLAARRVGLGGRAIGVDMTSGMRASARQSAQEAGLGEIVDIREGYFEALPVDDESVDVVISNGVVNLSPDKTRVFTEIYRVLKPGGRLYLADIVVQRELRLEARNNLDLWAAYIGGAVPQSELAELTARVGLKAARTVESFDCFRGTSAQHEVSKDLRPIAVNFFARK